MSALIILILLGFFLTFLVRYSVGDVTLEQYALGWAVGLIFAILFAWIVSGHSPHKKKKMRKIWSAFEWIVSPYGKALVEMTPGERGSKEHAKALEKNFFIIVFSVSGIIAVILGGLFFVLNIVALVLHWGNPRVVNSFMLM